jgi:hypothetical protein
MFQLHSFSLKVCSVGKNEHEVTGEPEPSPCGLVDGLGVRISPETMRWLQGLVGMGTVILPRTL